MGREIRRVPPNWEHPKHKEYIFLSGKYEERYRPLYDESYEESAKEWLADMELWLKGEYPSQKEEGRQAGNYPKTITGYATYKGDFPEVISYRPAWTAEEATAYQVYETVSEGTPVSPVFLNLEDMQTWLIKEGYPEKAAAAFCKGGWAPSMSFSPADGFKNDTESLG